MDATEALLNLLRDCRDKKQTKVINGCFVLGTYFIKEGSFPDISRVLYEFLAEPLPGYQYFVELGREEMENEEIKSLSASIVSNIKDQMNHGAMYFNVTGKRLPTVLDVIRTLTREGEVSIRREVPGASNN